MGYSAAYLTENADGVRQGWPRIPLPDKAEVLKDSARLGWDDARKAKERESYLGKVAGRPEVPPG